MKKYIIVLSFLPFTVLAQTDAMKINSGTVTTAAKKAVDEFIISGVITGYPDNTPIDLMNPNTGVSEASAKIAEGKFLLKGKMASPDFRILVINMQPPYLSIFLDNSDIKINATKETFQEANITGSKSNTDFVSFNVIAKPYESLFQPGNPANEALSKNAVADFQKYINEHPDSYVTPLAIYRYYQVTTDNTKLEAMYNNLPAAVKNASIATYLATLIKENNKNPIGKPMANFSQEDTSGKMVSLSSFKGKYVLVDFWASWCGPCRQENPNIVATYNKYKDKNFTVLGVSLDKAKDPWLELKDGDHP